MSVFEDLSWRGLVNQVTTEEMGAVLAREKLSVYIGFDPTATSLHAGSLIPLLSLQRFRSHGHPVIALLGGATGLIGDPSGKSTERNLETADVVAGRGMAMRRQMETFFSRFEGTAPTFVNNLDWLGPAKLLEFLRDVGKHFSVNQMIAKDSVRRRFEATDEGISFTEFSYALLQSADFLELYRRHGCKLQCGASDQWGNIVSGIDLIRRVESAPAYGMTLPLLTNSEGKKYGKTEKGAVWLDPTLTSPYAFYQFWFNTQDQDVVRFLKWFTMLSKEQVSSLEGAVGSGERLAQKTLAFEVTAIVHGRDQAERARAAAEALFGGELFKLPAESLKSLAGDVPSAYVDPAEVAEQKLGLLDLLVRLGACTSKSDARRQVRQGGVRLNGKPVPAAEEDRPIAPADFLEGQVLVVQRGKRDSRLAIIGSPPKA